MIKKIRHLIESSQARAIIQTNHMIILDIFQQFFITSIILTMRLNLRFVKASQFLQQFKLDVWHKPNKEYIISDSLNHLTSINVGYTNLFYSELDALFIYNITFVKIYPSLISRILAGYKDNKY